MSISAFTQEYGEHSRTERRVNRLEGKNFLQEAVGNPVVEYCLRLPGPRGPAADSDGFRRPKGYRRLIVKITEDSPWSMKNRDDRHLDDPNYDTYYTYHFSGGSGLPFNINESGYVSSLADNAEARATNKALNNLRQNRLQLGSDIAEARKTLDMVAGGVIPLAKAALAARRGNFGVIPGLLGLRKGDVLSGKYPANKFLEYQYGWKPLMSSVYDGIKVLENGFRKPKVPIYSAKGTGHESHQEEGKYFAGPGLVKGPLSYDFKSKVQLYYKVSSELIDSLDSAGVLNPVSIAWELVPFSFVVDWFIPIGSVLTAFSATAGLDFVGGYSTTTRRKSFHGHGSLPDDGSNRYRSLMSSGSYRVETFEMYRTALNSFPIPRFDAINTNPFSSAHVANALALLRQLI